MEEIDRARDIRLGGDAAIGQSRRNVASLLRGGSQTVVIQLLNRREVSFPVGIVRLAASVGLVCLIATGVARPALASGDTPGADVLSKTGDRAMKSGDCRGAVRAYEQALEDSALQDEPSISRIVKKLRAARRCYDEAQLIKAEKSLAAGNHSGLLRMRGIEDPVLREREYSLLRATADTLVAAGRPEVVHQFLQEFTCGESPCADLRRHLWRVLGSSLWTPRAADSRDAAIFATVALGESLRANGLLPSGGDAVLARRVKRGRQIHETAARASSDQAGATLFHLRMAKCYGALDSPELARATQAVRESLGVAWSIVPAATMTFSRTEFLSQVQAMVRSPWGPAVRVVVDLQECERGRYHRKAVESYASVGSVAMGTTSYTPGGSYTDPATGETTTWPSRTSYTETPHEIVVIKRREVARPVESFIVKGTATIALGGRSVKIPIDIHPTWESDVPETSEMLKVAASQLAQLIHESSPRLREQQVQKMLATSSSAMAKGRQAEAENALIMATLYGNAVPHSARKYFTGHYGLQPPDVLRLLRLDSP